MNLVVDPMAMVTSVYLARMVYGAFPNYRPSVDPESIVTDIFPPAPKPKLQYTSVSLNLDLTKQRERQAMFRSAQDTTRKMILAMGRWYLLKTRCTNSFPGRLRIKRLLLFDNTYGTETLESSLLKQFRGCGHFVTLAIGSQRTKINET